MDAPNGGFRLPCTRLIKEETTLKKIAFGALLLTWLTTIALADENPVGFQASTLPDSHNDRALEMVVWYPSATTATTQLIGDDVVFVGASAVRDAPPAAGKHPLLVLSHGYRGNWSNQIWLASALAHRGYIVAAINHPAPPLMTVALKQRRSYGSGPLMCVEPLIASRLNLKNSAWSPMTELQ